MPIEGSPNVPFTLIHRLIGSPGTGDRDQSERLLAINRNS